MGHKRTSNDVDLVEPNKYIVPKNKKAKNPPPKPWPLPEFEPLLVKRPYTYGAPNLPPNINPANPLALFKLIWTDDLLKELAAYTNKYILATQSIKARVRQKGRASLYNWIVYKRGSKARERKGGETEALLKAIYNPLIT